MANGQLLPINQNQALFSILGTTFGGDGRTNFALPDLRGRIAIGAGASAGLQSVTLGETGGTDFQTLTVGELPAHVHAIPNTSSATGIAGGNRPFDNRQAYLGLNFDIAMFGVFPARPLGAGDPTSDSNGSNPVGQGFIDGDQIIDETAAREMIDPVVQQAIRTGKPQASTRCHAAAQIVIGDAFRRPRRQETASSHRPRRLEPRLVHRCGRG